MDPEKLSITDENLGTGGFSTVFVGKIDGKTVAAKKLSQSEKEIDNIVSETKRIKKLRHGKHIAYTFGFTLKGDNLYIAMECSEHGDLRNYLQRNRESVTYEQKILFCRGILLGLLYCHSMKIFHGDIKCSNVILGKNLEPRLTDFGLSMTVDNIANYCKTCEGSIYWAAPELFSIEEEGNFEEFKANPYPTDVYSLGATFCQVSFDGTTEFIDSDNIEVDISLGLTSPTPKDAFLEEIVDGCCQFERNERISLYECLSMLDATAEEQLPTPAVNDEWLKIQQDIQANPELELPPSFVLHRPAKNLTVGSSNLSLIEWLCINDCTDAVKHMIELLELDPNQIEWLYDISKLCKSSGVTNFLREMVKNNKPLRQSLHRFIEDNTQELVESFIKAGADCSNYELLCKAIELQYNNVVQAIVERRSEFSDEIIHEAIKLGNAEVIRIFAAAGADLECRDEHGDTPLLAAISAKKATVVKILIELNVNTHGENQHMPLHRAALSENREIVELLIDAGVIIEVKSKKWQSMVQDLEQQGKQEIIHFILETAQKASSRSKAKSTPLCVAIQNGQLDAVQRLINDGADINEKSHDGYTPLHLAVTVNSEDIIKILIESGADFSIENRLEQTIMKIATEESRRKIEKIIQDNAPATCDSLRRAAKMMDVKTIEALANRQKNSANTLSDCLCIAARYGNIEVVECLVDHKINVKSKYEEKSPLEWAASGNHIAVMQILIDAGSSINSRNKYKETPLLQCVKKSQKEIVRFLIEKGADINFRDKNGNAPIHYAKDREIAEILINAGADVDAKGQCGATCLIQHVKRSNIEMVQFLVDKRADINSKDRYKNSPIYYAQSKEIVKILINAGADINAKNRYGRTPLLEHVKGSKLDIVQILLDEGADINVRDNYKNTAIHFVRDKEIAEILIAHDADINALNNNGKKLFDTLIKEQNRNYSNAKYSKSKVCDLLEYLNNLK